MNDIFGAAAPPHAAAADDDDDDAILVALKSQTKPQPTEVDGHSLKTVIGVCLASTGLVEVGEPQINAGRASASRDPCGQCFIYPTHYY